MIQVKQKIRFTNGTSGRRQIETTPAPEISTGRVPRISKLMALAIRFEGLLRDGIVADQSELARLAKVTQPRMTQIMNLLHLAPEIQEELLFLPRTMVGKERIHEKLLRSISAETDWSKQRQLWEELLGSVEINHSVSPEPTGEPMPV